MANAVAVLLLVFSWVISAALALVTAHDAWIRNKRGSLYDHIPALAASTAAPITAFFLGRAMMSTHAITLTLAALALLHFASVWRMDRRR
jgi:hypothetical protein